MTSLTAPVAAGLAGYPPAAVAVSAPSYTAAAAAGMGDVAAVERSPASYSSSVSMGGPAAASFTAALLPGMQAGLASTPSMEADGPESVERSGGSLLNWSRPPGRKPAGPHPGGGSSPGSRGSSAGTRPGRTSQVADAPAAAEDEQQSSRGGIRSFLRSAKSSPGSSARASRSGAAAPSSLSPAAHARSQSQLVAAGSAEAVLPAAAASQGGAYNSDLHSSVRNWQRQQGGDDACEASGQSFSQPGSDQCSQQEGLAVDGRSDSLLQRRLPSRAGSSRQAAAGMQHAPPAAAASGASPPRIGSASLRRTLSSFKQKLFGGGEAAETPKQATAAAAQQRQQGAGPDWSIGAVRAGVPSSQDVPGPGSTAGISGGVSGGIPPQDAQTSENLDSPDSPGKAAERLNRLRQMADKRRVWSAPLKAPEQADGSSSSPAADASSMAGTSAAAGSDAAAAAPGQRPPSGSTGPRPGLQALKARARTARLASSSSSVGAGQASSSLYSMEAVDDVFGPDKPVPSSPSSPLKAAPGSSSPLKVSLRGGFEENLL